MNEEIYNKLEYQIEKKDFKKKKSQEKFFAKLTNNTYKVYYKIWSKILYKYKKSNQKEFSYDLEINVEKKAINKYNIDCYEINDIRFGRVLVDVEKLLKLLDSDNISCVYCTIDSSGNLSRRVTLPSNLSLLKLEVREKELRELLEYSKKEYGRTTKVKGCSKTKIKGE